MYKKVQIAYFKELLAEAHADYNEVEQMKTSRQMNQSWTGLQKLSPGTATEKYQKNTG